jgi:hypothetical protein
VVTNPLNQGCQVHWCISQPEKDVPRCTEHLYSGRNPHWVRTLGDITAAECREYMAQTAEIPLKKCDALLGCSKPAEWYVDFHGCEGVCACDEHKAIWVYEINSTISDQGEIPCLGCNHSFTTLPRIMNWRPI